MNTGMRRASAVGEDRLHVLRCAGSFVQLRIDRLDQRDAEMRAEHRLDLLVGRRDDRLGRPSALPDAIDSRMMPMRMPFSEPGVPGVAAASSGSRRDGRRRGTVVKDVARIVVAVLRILQRVEHLRRVGDVAAVDAGAIVVDVGADGAAVEADQRLVRQDQRHRVVVGGTAAGRPRFLAQAAHRQVRARPTRRARAGSERCGARRVVRRSTGCRPRCCADSRAWRAAPSSACSCRRGLPRDRCIR